MFKLYAAVGNALGHANRLELLEILAQGQHDVDTLARFSELSVANTSHHLQLLRHAGLVKRVQVGQRVYYNLTDDSIVVMLALLRDVSEKNLAEAEKTIRENFGDKNGLKLVAHEELLARMDKGNVPIIDVRPESEFAAGHIAGAKNILLSELPKHLSKLPKRKEIVVYCRGPYCRLAYNAVETLRAAGLKARKLRDGFPEWRVAGLPVEVLDVEILDSE